MTDLLASEATDVATATLAEMESLFVESVSHDPSMTVLVQRVFELLGPVAVENVIARRPLTSRTTVGPTGITNGHIPDRS